MKTTFASNRWAAMVAGGGLLCAGFAAGCADPLPPDPRTDEVTMENPGLDKESETDAAMDRIENLNTDPDEAVADNSPQATNFAGVVTEVEPTALTLRQDGDKPQTFAVDPAVVVTRNGENQGGAIPLDSINVGQRVELAAEREDVENQNTIYVVKKITVLGDGVSAEGEKDQPKPEQPADKPTTNQPANDQSTNEDTATPENTDQPTGNDSPEGNASGETSSGETPSGETPADGNQSDENEQNNSQNNNEGN